MSLKSEQRGRTGGYLLAGLLLSGGVHAIIWQQLQQPELSVAAAAPESYQPVMLMAEVSPSPEKIQVPEPESEPESAPEPKSEPEPEPKPKPKPEPKPIPKKPKPTPKPKPEPKPKPLQTASPDRVTAPPVAARNPVNTQQPVTPVISAEQQRQRFLALLVQRIDQHKRYPRRAQSRGIEGRVSFKLSLDSHGALAKFEWLEGNRLFYKATLDAVKRSLPLPLPEGQGAFSYRLALEYKLL